MLIVLAIKALLLALIPLTLVYLSRGQDRYRRLAWVMVFFTFDLIVFGAFTRLTDSGLGCPDWPGCYGEANPLLAHEDIRAAQVAMPDGPVTLFKAWIEMIHRYLAMAVGVLIISSLLIGWKLWKQTGLKRYQPWLPILLLIFVCIQGAFGAWTVTLKLQPVIVTIHLLLGMCLLALLSWHALRQSAGADLYSAAKSDEPAKPVSGHAADLALAKAPVQSLRIVAAIALSLLFIQLALGGWVSTNYAALACTSFPLCQGAWMPEMDLAQGFTLWRKLGMTQGGEYLPFAALIAVHWVHRCFAVLVFLVVSLTAYLASRIAEMQALAGALFLLILLQLFSGVATVYFHWPLLLAVLHNAGAALLVLHLVMLNYRLASTAADTGAEFHQQLSTT